MNGVIQDKMQIFQVHILGLKINLEVLINAGPILNHYSKTRTYRSQTVFGFVFSANSFRKSFD